MKANITFVLCIMASLIYSSAGAQQTGQVVHVAKLRINPAHLESYKAALKEEIETSVRVEPGVLKLDAVAEKNNPSSIIILEVYADSASYKSHLQTPHFKKYKSATKDMVKSLELIDAEPIVITTKPKE
jgi:quinol monooxygenase YgiN